METQDVALDQRAGFKHILLCIDPTAASGRAAVFVPHLTGKGTQVRIVGVVENARAVIPLGPLAAFHLSAAHALLLQDVKNACAVAQELFALSGAKVEIQLIDLVTHGGDVVHALAKAAQDWQADLLVMGSRQHQGLLHWVEGSLSEPLMKFADCAILVVPERCDIAWSGRPQRIMFAVDGSAAAQEALRTGARLARSQAELRVVHVVDRAVRFSDFVPLTVLEDALVKEGQAILSKAQAFLEMSAGVIGVRIEAELASTDTAGDDIPHTIAREARRWHADLLVMGTHGRRGIVRCLLGSVASRVAAITCAPLMLVRQKDIP